jgi:hypothetical protein
MGLEIRAVTNDKELQTFLRVPVLLRPENRVSAVPSRWVRLLLDRRKNPYYRHTDHVFLVAWREGRVVGRIAAFVDHLCNRVRGEQAGSFALFDCLNSLRVAARVFEAAEAWLASKQVSVVRGPLGPAMRLGTGLLIEGHGQVPTIGTSLDPAELGPLIESAGYQGVRDMHAYWLRTDPLPAPVVAAADAARRRRGLSLRTFDPRRFDEDVVRLGEVMNDAPETGWTCVPWTSEEVRWYARKLWPVLDPSLILFAEQGAEPVGGAFALRNVRDVLGGRNPRASVTDSLRLAAALRLNVVHTARIALLSARARARGPGGGGEGDLSALLLAELLGRLRLTGVNEAEVSLVDSGDTVLIDLLTAAGAEVTKTFRVYEKRL